MKVVQERDDGSVVIELTKHERGMVGLVGTEFTEGACSPSDEDWETLIPVEREEVANLFDRLLNESA